MIEKDLNSNLANVYTIRKVFDFFFTFFVKSKLSTAKKSKTTTISRVFHPKKSTILLGKSKLDFCTKK